MFRNLEVPLHVRRESQRLNEALAENRNLPGVEHLCHRLGKSERRRQKQGVPEHKRKKEKPD